MKNKELLIFFAVIVLLLLFGASIYGIREYVRKNDVGDLVDSKIDGNIYFVEKEAEIPEDEYYNSISVRSMKYQDGKLNLEVSHATGCGSHDFRLYVFNSLSEDTPPKLLVFPFDAYTGGCEAAAFKTLSFDMDRLFARYDKNQLILVLPDENELLINR